MVSQNSSSRDLKKWIEIALRAIFLLVQKDPKESPKVWFFKNRLHLINYTRVYIEKNLHNSKKNINFARFLSGKLVNGFSEILKIGHFAKCVLQRMVFGRKNKYNIVLFIQKGQKWSEKIVMMTKWQSDKVSRGLKNKGVCQLCHFVTANFNIANIVKFAMQFD